MAVRASTVDVHIGTLVIEGGSSTGRHEHAATAAALERSLARLLGGRPLPARLQRDGRAASLDGGAITVSGGAAGPVLGASVAGAVYRSLEAGSWTRR